MSKLLNESSFDCGLVNTIFIKNNFIQNCNRAYTQKIFKKLICETIRAISEVKDWLYEIFYKNNKDILILIYLRNPINSINWYKDGYKLKEDINTMKPISKKKIVNINTIKKHIYEFESKLKIKVCLKLFFT